MRGVNDDELGALIEYGQLVGAEVRFIEYMDVGGATKWSPEDVVSRREMLERLARASGRSQPIVEESSAPADRFRLADGTTFGIISSTTEPFCATCDRARLTADGVWLMCLYARAGTDLRRPLRAGATREEIEQLDRHGVGVTRRPRRRGTAGRSAEGNADSGDGAQEGCASRDAHSGGMTKSKK